MKTTDEIYAEIMQMNPTEQTKVANDIAKQAVIQRSCSLAMMACSILVIAAKKAAAGERDEDAAA